MAVLTRSADFVRGLLVAGAILARQGPGVAALDERVGRCWGSRAGTLKVAILLAINESWQGASGGSGTGDLVGTAVVWLASAEDGGCWIRAISGQLGGVGAPRRVVTRETGLGSN
jgi:hypothetical protein